MSTAVSGIVAEKTDNSILVIIEGDGAAIWFNIYTDIIEEDRDDAEMFDEGEEVDFNVTDACAKKHEL